MNVKKKKLLAFCFFGCFILIEFFIFYYILVNKVPYEVRKSMIQVFSCHKIQDDFYRDFCECTAERFYSLDDFDVTKLIFKAIFSLDSKKILRKVLYDKAYPYCVKYIVENYPEGTYPKEFKDGSFLNSVRKNTD